jgi:protein-S-isoprenylcysteine O-methyltransferase Ste14
MTRRSSVPLVLGTVLSLGVIVLAWRKLGEWHGPAALLGATVSLGYVAWVLWELRVSVADMKHPSVQADRWTVEAYAVAQGATALTALLLPTHHPLWPALFMGLGAFVFGGGVLLRVVAVRALGASYSHRVRVRDAHLVVSTGPYRWLRHPAYSGMLAAHLGFVLVFFNEVSLSLLAAGLLPAVVARISVEERALQTVPGYAEFCRDRARLVPFVW